MCCEANFSNHCPFFFILSLHTAHMLEPWACWRPSGPTEIACESPVSKTMCAFTVQYDSQELNRVLVYLQQDIHFHHITESVRSRRGYGGSLLRACGTFPNIWWSHTCPLRSPPSKSLHTSLIRYSWWPWERTMDRSISSYIGSKIHTSVMR